MSQSLALQAIFLALNAILLTVSTSLTDNTAIERLLWPQRFYNDDSVGTLIALAVFTPLGCVFDLAYKTFITFLTKGLLTPQRGDMNGSAFFPSWPRKYFSRLSLDSLIDILINSKGCDVQNGFWLTVLKLVNANVVPKLPEPKPESKAPTTDRDETEEDDELEPQLVYMLSLRSVSIDQVSPKTTVVREEVTSKHKAMNGITCSEIIPIFLFVFVSFIQPTSCSQLLFLAPLAVKVLALHNTLRRVGLKFQGSINKRASMSTPAPRIFEVHDSEIGKVLMRGTDITVRQFFGGYGHPVRHSNQSRVQEVNLMTLVIILMFLPLGSMAFFNLFSDLTRVTPWIWLGYQFFTVFASFIGQATGLSSRGRTEVLLAKALTPKNGGTCGQAVLMGEGIFGIEASLIVETVYGDEDGYTFVNDVTRVHAAMMEDIKKERIRPSGRFFQKELYYTNHTRDD